MVEAVVVAGESCYDKLRRPTRRGRVGLRRHVREMPLAVAWRR